MHKNTETLMYTINKVTKIITTFVAISPKIGIYNIC